MNPSLPAQIPASGSPRAAITNPRAGVPNPKSTVREPPSEFTRPQSDETQRAPGRPRALDEVKRREICALVAGGCGLREAAKYVGCSVQTIRREAARTPDFDEQLRRAEMYAQLSPLRAMQNACSTHWRAAAWFLERAFPERFARPEPGTFGPRQARHLLNEVLHILRSELPDSALYERIEKRLRATFEYSIRAVCDRRRSARELRRAMAFFEEKEARDDPLAGLGFPQPDFATLFEPLSKFRSATPAHAANRESTADADIKTS